VIGLSKPIFTSSAARAVITKGEVICATPANAAVFRMVRRSSAERISDVILLFLPGLFL